MKPPPFRYVRAETVDHALEALEEAGPEGKVLAGGQSLVPMLNLRLARPSVLVDIEHLGLDTMAEDGRTTQIGAGVRQSRLIEDDLIAAHIPILAQAARYIGHPAVRNRGTVGGSLCHADPTAELPLMALLLDAQMEIRSRGGVRTVAADDFFLGAFTTVTESEDLLTSIRIPLPEADRRDGFLEVAERTGDFALAAAGVSLIVDNDTIRAPRVVLAGAADRPIRSAAAEQVLDESAPTEDVIGEAASAAISDVDPPDDVHATSDYRRHLLRVIVERAVKEALRGRPWTSN